MGSHVVTRKTLALRRYPFSRRLTRDCHRLPLGRVERQPCLIARSILCRFFGCGLHFAFEKVHQNQPDKARLVLSGFYAVGICMLTRIQKMDFGNQSGLDTYLFGQVSALSTNDLIGVCASFVLITYS